MDRKVSARNCSIALTVIGFLMAFYLQAQKLVRVESFEDFVLAVSIDASSSTSEEIQLFLPLVLRNALATVGITKYRDLEFDSFAHGGTVHSLLLDLYVPKQGAGQLFPLLIYIHGGGWLEGSKDMCPADPFAEKGYAVACVNYRLGQPDGCPAEYTFPVQIHDVKAAVRWLRMNAGQYCIDPNRFGVWGDSSGGHLAALLGASAGVPELEGPGNPGVSDEVQAIADWYGPVDVTQPPPTIVFEDDPCKVSLSDLINLYGGEETPYFYWTLAWGVFLGGSLVNPVVLQHANQATPLTYGDAHDPPFLIIHGEADGMVPIDQSALLDSALKGAGIDVTFIRLPGVGHDYSGAGGQQIASEFLEPTLTFFDKHLKDK